MYCFLHFNVVLAMAFVDGQAGDKFSTLFEVYCTIPLTDHWIFRTLAGLASTYCASVNTKLIGMSQNKFLSLQETEHQIRVGILVPA